MSLPPLLDIIKAYQLEPKKGLGQHFLLDPALLDRIAASAGITADTNVIEIGPGPGGLTRGLFNTPAKSITVVEKDSRCIAALQAQFPAINIVEADALTLDVTTLAPAPRAIVSNLPYNIGTELLAGWLDIIHADPAAISSLTLMFQKEVADRVIAPEGGKTRGRLSVMAQWLCEVEHVFDIPAEAFYPPPKVVSTLIRLKPRPKPSVGMDKEALAAVLMAAFNQRRKMLRASLKSMHADIEARLANVEIDPTLRPEALSVEQWSKVVKAAQK